MILYTAGPMTGIENFNYPAFYEAKTALGVAGYEVWCPADIDILMNATPTVPQEWQWYMRHAMRMLLASDGVALLPGWEDSRGAQLEVYVARELDMPIQTVASWIADMNEPVRLQA